MTGEMATDLRWIDYDEDGDMTGEMATTATATTDLKWISYDGDSIEVKAGMYGYYEGDFGISAANNQQLIAWHDRLTTDQPRVWRRTGSELAKCQWLDELAEVQTELIRRYFNRRGLPDVIAEQCADVDWDNSEIDKMIAEVYVGYFK